MGFSVKCYLPIIFSVCCSFGQFFNVYCFRKNILLSVLRVLRTSSEIVEPPR